jgi:hypothetical protein
MAPLTLHDVAVSPYPIGIECSHCLRHALLAPEAVRAKVGDTRSLEQAGLRCSKCRSRTFTTIQFEKRSRLVAFMRNL